MNRPPNLPIPLAPRQFSCLAVAFVVALMIAMPAAPGDAFLTWWFALVLAAFTLGTVFPRDAILIACTLGFVAPLVQFIASIAAGPAAALPAIDDHAFALIPALLAAHLGACARRGMPIPVPDRSLGRSG
jgi:hypothetical protein